jgi:DNA repair protein RadC
VSKTPAVRTEDQAGTAVETADCDEAVLAALALIVGAGRRSAASDAAARRLLHGFSHTLDLARASTEELRRCGRISSRRASLISAALEMGRLAFSNPLRPGERFSSSRDLFLRYRTRFRPASKEYFFSLHLNAKNQLLREVLVSVGSLSTSVVHPREVFGPAVRDSAASIILLHNHPSGDPVPSREDRECTQRLVQGGRLMGVRVLDHVILGHEDYFSFADAALLADTP